MLMCPDSWAALRDSSGACLELLPCSQWWSVVLQVSAGGLCGGDAPSVIHMKIKCFTTMLSEFKCAMCVLCGMVFGAILKLHYFCTFNMALCFDSRHLSLPTGSWPVPGSAAPWISLLFLYSQIWISQSCGPETLTVLSHVVHGYPYSIVLSKGLLELRTLASHSHWDWWWRWWCLSFWTFQQLKRCPVKATFISVLNYVWSFKFSLHFLFVPIARSDSFDCHPVFCWTGGSVFFY